MEEESGVGTRLVCSSIVSRGAFGGCDVGVAIKSRGCVWEVLLLGELCSEKGPIVVWRFYCGGSEWWPLSVMGSCRAIDTLVWFLATGTLPTSKTCSPIGLVASVGLF